MKEREGGMQGSSAWNHRPEKRQILCLLPGPDNLLLSCYRFVVVIIITFLCCYYLCFLVVFLFFFFLFSATPMAYGGSQARCGIRATAAGVHHSHNNAGSGLHL